MKKIAFISCHPAPYRDSFISRCVSILGESISVYSQYPCDKGHSFGETKNSQYVSETLNPDGRSSVRLLVGVLRKFVFGDYALVIWPGFMDWYIVFAMFVSALFGTKYGFSADTVKQRPIGLVSHALKKFVVRHASIILVPGQKSKHFFASEYGVPDDKIFLGCYSLDGVEIERKVSALREVKRINNETVTFLMVANMIPTRHYPVTCRGFAKFAKRHKDVRFIVVGNGPESDKIKEFANDHPSVEVHDGCTFDEMLRLYAIADVYVHGGTEPASTALVIGAIAHLPIISSKGVGCSADVLRDGINGFEVADYMDEDLWAEGFDKMYANRDKWGMFGEESRRFSRQLDVDNTANLFANKMLDLANG